MNHGMSIKDEGFTLIETAMALILIGLLVVPMLEAWKIQRQKDMLAVASGNITIANDSINNFVFVNTRYPKPASLLAAPGDPEYGVEVTGAVLPCPSWPTPNGVCRTTGPNPVLIGALPFKSIGLSEEQSVDFWDNKLLYAITSSQSDLYAIDSGQVVVRGFDEDLAGNRYMVTLAPRSYPLGAEARPLDLYLLSHGENGAGAYNRQGALVAPCDAAQGVDSENCDMDAIFWTTSHEFPEHKIPDPSNEYNGRISSWSLNPGVDYFDDITTTNYQANVPSDYWFENNTDPDFLLTTNEQLGIGTEIPDAKIHVVGNVMSERVFSDDICADGGPCFNSRLVGGNDPAMNCQNSGLDRPVVRIINGQFRCAESANSAGGTQTSNGQVFRFPSSQFNLTQCPGAQMMTGINASGVRICADLP